MSIFTIFLEVGRDANRIGREANPFASIGIDTMAYQITDRCPFNANHKNAIIRSISVILGLNLEYVNVTIITKMLVKNVEFAIPLGVGGSHSSINDCIGRLVSMLET